MTAPDRHHKGKNSFCEKIRPDLTAANLSQSFAQKYQEMAGNQVLKDVAGSHGNS